MAAVSPNTCDRQSDSYTFINPSLSRPHIDNTYVLESQDDDMDMKSGWYTHSSSEETAGSRGATHKREPGRTCHACRYPRSQPNSSRRKEEGEEPALVSYDGSRKNEQFIYSLLHRRKRRRVQELQHWNMSMRTTAAYHTRRRRGGRGKGK